MEVEVYMRHIGLVFGPSYKISLPCNKYPCLSSHPIQVPYGQPRAFVAIWKQCGDVFVGCDTLLTYRDYIEVAELPDAMIIKHYKICAIVAAVIFVKFGRKLIYQVKLTDVPSRMKHLINDVVGLPERWIALVTRLPGFVDWYIANLANDWKCYCIGCPAIPYAFNCFYASLQTPENPNEITSLCSYDIVREAVLSGKYNGLDNIHNNRILTNIQKLNLLILTGEKLSGYFMISGITFRDLSLESVIKLIADFE
jgi:hypothetical protein